jgi:hypothetical protein
MTWNPTCHVLDVVTCNLAQAIHVSRGKIRAFERRNNTSLSNVHKWIHAWVEVRILHSDVRRSEMMFPFLVTFFILRRKMSKVVSM